jgi:hypothetical protein
MQNLYFPGCHSKILWRLWLVSGVSIEINQWRDVHLIAVFVLEVEIERGDEIGCDYVLLQLRETHTN